MSWFMAAWTLTTMWLMSERWYKVAWTSSLCSQLGWAYIAITAGLHGMLALSVVMVFIATRALLKLKAT